MQSCNVLQISKVYTHYAATLLFFFFGLRSLYDAFFKKDDVCKYHHERVFRREVYSLMFMLEQDVIFCLTL